MKLLIIFFPVYFYFFIFINVCYSQTSLKATYSTILESENFQELESVLIYDANKNSVFYSLDKEVLETSSG